MTQRNARRLAGHLAIPALFSLVWSVGSADALPELDCLVEPNVVVDVGSPEHGVVEMIAVDRSDTVAARDVLAQLESSEQVANVRKARARANMAAEVNARKATLELAERKQQRMRDLFASDAISTHQRDEVETELKMAQMQLQQARDASSLARIELDRARAELDKRTIRSPISGVIVERFVAPGEFVNEKPLLRVAQMHPLRVETVAPAELFGKIKNGMQARVLTETQGGKAYEAEVTIVDRLIDPASGTFGVRLELPNPEYAIPSGLNCRLQILPRQRAATVPEPEPAVESDTASPLVAAEPAAPARTEPVAAVAESEPAVGKPAAEPVVAEAESQPRDGIQESESTVTMAQSEPVVVTEQTQSAVSKPESVPERAIVEQEPVVVASKPKAPAPAAAAATPVQAPELTCTSFGPLDSDDQIDALIASLDAGAREVGRRADEYQTTEGFFVATRPLASPEAAQRLTQRMEKFGMAGLAVMPDGPDGARVSLGLFEDRAVAQKLKQKLAALGIATEILPKRIDTRQVWLDVEMSVDSLEKAPWEALMLSGIGSVECPSSVRETWLASVGMATKTRQSASQCLSIGPFSREQQIDALVAVLGNDSREIDRRRESDGVGTRYLVMTTPQNSLGEADTLAASIRDRGVQDLAVMRAGSYKGRVSLGLYAQKAVAMIRVQEMQNLGFDVELVPERNGQVQFWSDIELSANAIEQAPWKKIAPDVITTDCPPSSYVIADAAEAP